MRYKCNGVCYPAYSPIHENHTFLAAPMPKPAHDYAEVRQAAIACLTAGLNPSWREVRERLGSRGSATTLNEALKHFRAEVVARFQTPPLPEALIEPAVTAGAVLSIRVL